MILPPRLRRFYTMAEMLRHPWRIIRPETTSPITLATLGENIRGRKRLIYFGETHEESEIIQLQLAVLNLLVEEVNTNKKGKVNVIMEHFNISQQPLLDDYLSGKIDGVQLTDQYHSQGEEGHDINKYSSILEFAKANTDRVQLIGGFLPRNFARVLVKEGREVAYTEAVNRGYLTDLNDAMEGTDEHFNFFDSLISGRNLRENFDGVADTFRKIFPAQTIKDDTMASVIRRKLIESTEYDKFLVIAGSGHLDHRLGVPERVDRHDVIKKDETCIITVRQLSDPDFANEEGKPSFIVEGFREQFPGDFILLYVPDEENEELIKSEISSAYDKVASSAHMEGNLRLANKVMTRLGYSQSQIETAGMDAYNYQGVGCPHKHANITPGEQVLDVGSGLGVDSFIAGEAVGPHGSVIGLDISKGEVIHATERAKARNVRNIEFVHGDMETMPFESETFNVVISNGAFCLAPDKEKAFREIYRVLKPGGRFSVACTVLLKQLDGGVNWPICMRVFMPIDKADPMLESIGFQEVAVDDSDSKMDLEIDVEPETSEGGGQEEQRESVEEGQASTTRGRTGVHVGSEEFRHLANFNMDEICARVVLTGHKPR